MQAKFLTAVFLGFVLITASACGGGGSGDDDLRTSLEEAEAALEEEKAAREKAEKEASDAAKDAADAAKAAKEAADAAKAAKEEAKTEADKLAAEKQRADAAEEKLEDAEDRAQQAEEDADRRIEEAEKQANVAARVTPLRTALSDLSSQTTSEGRMGVTHMRGEQRTFTRPNNLPVKGSAPSVPGSWASASYSGPRGNVGTDTVYLYTNIQAPSSRAFWKVYGESVDVSAGVLPTDPKATVSGFGTSGQIRKLHEADQATLSRPGTYGGYSGTFRCTSADSTNPECNISADASDVFTFVGGWKFTTSLTAKRSSSLAEQDTEFLYFGIWAFEPTDAAGTPEFKWAHGGASVIGNDNFTALTGEAKFTGGAIGKYALAKVGGRAAKIGTFTATASFTADFGADDTAGTLSGRITDFKDGGTSLGSNWNVFLGSDASTAATLAATGVSTQATGAHGAIDGDTATGAWAATLHGNSNSTSLDREKYSLNKYPVADVAGVSGWFNAASGGNAAIAGAFGAACTTGTMCAK